MKPIVNIIGEVVEATNTAILPYLQTVNSSYVNLRYDYGHPSEIIGKIEQMNKTNANRFLAYPLIGLFLDFPEQRGGNPEFGTAVKLNLFICCQTMQGYTPVERTSKSFIPILIPIYNEFLNQMLKHKDIVKPEFLSFKHKSINRYQWGKEGIEFYDNSKKNIFNDFIDAIEIQGLEFSIYNDNTLCNLEII